MADLQTDDLSQAELLCYQPAHELCRSYRQHDLVEAVTNIIIIMLIIIVIGLFLWVNTKGWELPMHSPRKRWGEDVEGQFYLYRDIETDNGNGHGQDAGLETVEKFVEIIRRLAVEGKISWETYEEVERVRKGQAQGVREGSGAGDCGGAVTKKTISGEYMEKMRIGDA